MNTHDNTYLQLVYKVMTLGERRGTRSGPVRSLFSVHADYPLDEGFPLLTTKKVLFDSVVKELLWFLRGETNTATLGCKIWDAWADSEGELGPIYGAQWRNFGGVDQIAGLVDSLRRDPFSRRHIVSAWNPPDVPNMALPPCHVMFQCFVHQSGTLDLQLYQRSGDLALGIPFNIASYSLLLVLLARETGLKPGTFHHTIGDLHIYENHTEGLRQQLERRQHVPPRVEILGDRDLFSLRNDDVVLVDYTHEKFIPFPIAV